MCWAVAQRTLPRVRAEAPSICLRSPRCCQLSATVWSPQPTRPQIRLTAVCVPVTGIPYLGPLLAGPFSPTIGRGIGCREPESKIPVRQTSVTRLQQAAKIALVHNRALGIAIISAMSKGMWWLYFRRSGKLVGVAIIEAPTLYHARTRLAVRGIGRVADYSDAKKLDDGDAALVLQIA